jgi:predicted ABC-type ATPase
MAEQRRQVALMTQAKVAGFEVGLVFVTTSDPKINVKRVANRVELGGHSVKLDKIRSRYHDALVQVGKPLGAFQMGVNV